jgi:hypothetical protein
LPRRFSLRGSSSTWTRTNRITALDRDIEIIVRKKPASRRSGKIVVTAA